MASKPTHAGVVTFRQGQGGPEFLVVSTSRNRRERVFPKGHIEAGEDAETAALREAREEAGVTAKIVTRVGETAFVATDEPVRTVYFLAEFLSDATPDESRAREWLDLDRAMSALTFDDSREILRQAAEHLRDRGGGSGCHS